MTVKYTESIGAQGETRTHTPVKAGDFNLYLALNLNDYCRVPFLLFKDYDLLSSTPLEG